MLSLPMRGCAVHGILVGPPNSTPRSGAGGPCRWRKASAVRYLVILPCSLSSVLPPSASSRWRVRVAWPTSQQFVNLHSYPSRERSARPSAGMQRRMQTGRQTHPLADRARITPASHVARKSRARPAHASPCACDHEQIFADVMPLGKR